MSHNHTLLPHAHSHDKLTLHVCAPQAYKITDRPRNPIRFSAVKLCSCNTFRMIPSPVHVLPVVHTWACP
jgi:hypothetical protein